MALSPRIGALLLAAGLGRRFGGPNKLLAPLDGRPLVAHAAAAIDAAGLPLLAVLGRDADAVRAAVRAVVPAAGFVVADDHALGLGHSVANGARAVPPDWAGVLLCLGDMPRVAPATLAALAAAIDGPAAVAVPVHAGVRGNPVAFGRAWVPRLAALSGDTGARALLAGAAVTGIAADAGVLADIDTPAALAATAPPA